MTGQCTAPLSKMGLIEGAKAMHAIVREFVDMDVETGVT